MFTLLSFGNTSVFICHANKAWELQLRVNSQNQTDKEQLKIISN